MIGDQALWRACHDAMTLSLSLPEKNGMNLLTIVPGYNSRYDTERFIVDIRRLVEHDQVVVPLLRGKDAFAMVDEPVEFRARRNNFPKSSIQHYGSH